ncbi:hypothetical protein COY07_03235 [Candidatus Peregrinibacteria bacterium CG_4_10_14_0_2_um_filter_43_11]|nr:MAG: hypothetical protein COY07_03235 [Candidatus Peregrinibacteria bacterium CG_4_10_14_0_2_um_filter_43_11]
MIALDSIIGLLTTYKYLLLFPIAVVEGPIVSVIGGFLCSGGFLSLSITYGLLILADLIGDTIYYSIGRFGGRPFIKRWGHIFGITTEKLSQTEKHFHHHAGKTLAIGKTQPWGMLVLIASGLSKMSYIRFMLLNLAVTIFKTAGLMAIGYYFGKSYKIINHYFGFYGEISMILATALIIGYFLISKTRKT